MPPYFINPDIDALATASLEQREALTRKIAACVGDECALRTIIGISPEEFRNFYPDMTPRSPSTDDTISSFISIFSSEKKAATPQVENLVPEQKTQDTATASEPIVPTAPAVDYALMMDEPEDEQADEASQQTGDATPDIIFPPSRTTKDPNTQKRTTPKQPTEATGPTRRNNPSGKSKRPQKP